MVKPFLVKKYSGESEPFSFDKLRGSLSRSGGDEALIDMVVDALQPKLFDGISTGEIYRRAFTLLRRFKRSTAARYSLKNAIMELGPTGYPFEKFIGELFSSIGYEVFVGQLVRGHCVLHEVDVLARNDHEQLMVECKYYNNQGKYCNVQVPLYIDSRFRDIEKNWQLRPENASLKFRGCVVTNTRFTTDALEYGLCAGLTMISWVYPGHNSLKDMIEQSGLFPITVLTSLTRKHKQHLLDKKIVLVRQLLSRPGVLNEIGLTGSKKDKVVNEMEELIGEI